MTAAASSPSSRPTSRSRDAIPTRPRTMSSSSPGGILQAHPPPWAYWVSRSGASSPSMYADLPQSAAGHAARRPCAGTGLPGRRVTGPAGAPPQPDWVRWRVEVSGHLVVPPVFKTGEAEHLGLAGSIPVHLRQHVRASSGRRRPDVDGSATTHGGGSRAPTRCSPTRPRGRGRALAPRWSRRPCRAAQDASPRGRDRTR